MLTVAVAVLALQALPSPVPASAGAADDLARLRAALLALHAGLDRYGARADVDAAFDRLLASPPRTPRELRRAVAGLAPFIRDGHTRVEMGSPDARLLPLQAQVSGDRLFVSRDCRGSTASLTGREILEIDGVPAARIVGETVALRPRDGFNETYPRWALGRPLGFADALSLARGEQASWAVTVGSPRETVVLKAEDRASLEACGVPALPRGDGLRFEPDGVAVLTIASFVPDLGEAFASWFRSLAEHQATGLVIDVRDNGGGLDRNGSALVAHLVGKSFRYYDSIVVRTLDPPPPFEEVAALLRPWRIEPGADGQLHFTGHENLGLQQPRVPRFEGRVVVLINGGTFSAASEFAAVIRALRRATFVGEEAGGAVNGNTAGVSADILLPWSGVRVRVPLMRYEIAAPGLTPGHGVMPDVLVAPTVADLLAGRDVALDRALSEARRPTPKEMS